MPHSYPQPRYFSNKVSDRDLAQASQTVEYLENFNATIDYDTVKSAYQGMLVATPQYKMIYKEMLDSLAKQAMTTELGSNRKQFLPIPLNKQPSSKELANLGSFYQGDRVFNEFPVLVELDKSIHTSLTGKTNTGKTVILYNLCLEIDRINESRPEDDRIFRIVIDYKNDFKNIPNQIVLSIRETPFNPLDPAPEIDFITWLPIASQLLMYIWQVYPKARNIFEGCAMTLWKRHDCKKIPTIVEIRDMMVDEYRNYKITSRREEGLEVVFERLDHMIFQMRTAYSHRKTFPLELFAKFGIPLVIDCRVSEDNYQLVAGILMQRLYKYNEIHNIRGNVGKNGNNGTVFIIDEAGFLYDKSRTFSEMRRDNGPDAITRAPTWMRDFRILLVTASQRPPMEEVSNSADLMIVGKLPNWEDAQYMANCLGRPDLAKMITDLNQGNFIVKYDNHVALLQTRNIELPLIDEDWLAQQMKPFMDFICDYCKEPDEEESRQEDQQPKLNLSENGRELLFNVWAFPDSKISDRYEHLKLEGENQRATVDELVRSGYAEEVKLVIDSKSSTYLVLTKRATDWLKRVGKNCEHLTHIGRQGPAHSMYQQLLISRLRTYQKMNVWHDRPLPGNDPNTDKIVDVYAESGDKKMAFEIAINDDIDGARTGRALSSVDDYIILTLKLETEKAIRLHLKGIDDKGKIKYVSLKKYLTGTKSSNIGLYSNNNQNPQDGSNKADQAEPSLEAVEKSTNTSNSDLPGNNSEEEGGPNK